MRFLYVPFVQSFSLTQGAEPVSALPYWTFRRDPRKG